MIDIETCKQARTVTLAEQLRRRGQAKSEAERENDMERIELEEETKKARSAELERPASFLLFLCTSALARPLHPLVLRQSIRSRNGQFTRLAIKLAIDRLSRDVKRAYLHQL